MESLTPDRTGLAAALFHKLGAAVPYPHEEEKEAERLFLDIPSEEKRLLKIVELCGKPQTPKQYYLLALAYSWLGSAYHKETARYAGAYLNTAGWGELPHKTLMENGILMNQTAAHRAEVLDVLAQAQEGQGNYEAALANFMEAYRLEPHNAMHAIRAADVIARCRSRKEALNYLEQQKSSSFYHSVKYTDAQGTVRHNDTFRQLLDAHILKLKKQEAEVSW